MNKKILAIDDDEVFLKSLKKILVMNNFEVEICSNPMKSLELINSKNYNCIISDVKMPGVNGIELQKAINRISPGTPVIAISGQSNIAIAVEMIRNGTYDFIEKPVDEERLIVILNNAIEKQYLTEEKNNILKELSDNYRMVGVSRSFKDVLIKIDSIAPTDARVLITGETGVGKELVAWAIHHNSPRKNKPYIKINCAAIPGELMESELFGHRKGSFTGADRDHSGKFIAANGGTLLLDEIGDLDLQLQSKLLRVLEENEVEIVGENIPIKIDVRILAVTNKNLEEEINNKRFRLDLFHRINVFEIVVSPLRHRKEDILPIAEFNLQKYCNIYNKRIKKLNPQVEGLLLNREWKGNVRELCNVIEKLVLLSEGEIIDVDDYYKILQNNHYNESEDLSVKTYKGIRDKFKKKMLLEILEKHNWKVVDAAKELGLERTNLFKKMQKFGIRKDLMDNK